MATERETKTIRDTSTGEIVLADKIPFTPGWRVKKKDENVYDYYDAISVIYNVRVISRLFGSATPIGYKATGLQLRVSASEIYTYFVPDSWNVQVGNDTVTISCTFHKPPIDLVLNPSSAPQAVLKKIKKYFERIFAEIFDFCSEMQQKRVPEVVFAGVFFQKSM